MKKQFWILAGQSNMQGVGLLAGALSPDPRVTAFTMAGQWEVAQEPLHPLWESFLPVHQNLMRPGMAEADQQLSDAEHAARFRSEAWGTGPGLAFGLEMARLSGDEIALLPAAHGGTSLEQWNFKRRDEGGASLYGAMLERVRRAEADVTGVLWYQGESDAFSFDNASTYEARFTAWIEALRSDLGKPDLPVLIVQLGRWAIVPNEESDKGWSQLREAQRQVAEKVAHVGLVSALDLGITDTIHIDTPGMNRLGKRLALVAQRMAQKADSPFPRVVRVDKVAPHAHFNGTLRLICDGVTGSWNPALHLAGFSLRDANGALLPDQILLNADRDPEDSTAIRFLMSGTADATTRLWYGWGTNPYVNLVDDADLPLPAFSGLAIDGV